MSGLARIFEQEGFSTVLVGFVREHIQAYQPPRALWLNFPMGRPMGRPNDPEFQKQVIRAAFTLLEKHDAPVLEDFASVIPVVNGRMSYAIPPEYGFSIKDIGDVDKLVSEIQIEIEELRPRYDAAVKSRQRTTVGASTLQIESMAPHIGAFVKGERPKSPRKGLSPIPGLKLVVEDLQAVYTEAKTFEDDSDDLERIGEWFWMECKAGKLIMWLEAVALASDDNVLRRIVEMSLLTPRFWSE